MSVTITLGGSIQKLSRHLKKLSVVDFEDINLTIAEAMKASTKRRFKTGTDPKGKAWQRSQRLEGKKRGRTLVDTARLRNSIRGRATSDLAEVGTNVLYAGRHQFGDKKPMTIRAKNAKNLRFQIGGRWISKKEVKVKLPARPYLGIGDTDLEEIKAILEAVAEEVGK